MERLPPPPAALLPPIADQQKRVSYERTSDSASYERTSDSYEQRTSSLSSEQACLSSYEQQTSPLSDQQRACLIRSLSDRLTDFQQEEKSRGRTVPSPPLRLHHTHLRKQFEGGGKAQLAFGQPHHQQQGQGGAGQVYPQQPFPTGKPLHGPI